MSTNELLVWGVLVFGLLIVALVLTVVEFRKMH